jgi:segregation and condensation protein A
MMANGVDPGASGGPQAPGFEPLLSAAEQASGMGYAVKLAFFEGPLDLLLHLIRENEVDVTEISIARVAEQYLEYLALMRELHLDIAAEYLVMAATLAWIKSRMLVPAESSVEESEGPDPRAELVARLLEYQRFQQAAAELDRRPLLGRDVFAPPGVEPGPEDRDPATLEVKVSLFELIEAFREVLRRAQGAGIVHEVVVETLTVRERMIAVMDQLAGAESVEFMDLLPSGGGPAHRALLIATFLALLELTRLAAVRIYQGVNSGGAPQGPIRVRLAGEGVDAWSTRISDLM